MVSSIRPSVTQRHGRGLRVLARRSILAEPDASDPGDQPRHRRLGRLGAAGPDWTLRRTEAERREIVQFNVTASPTAAWMWQQLINATPWSRQPRYLIHDRDAAYGKQFDARLGRLGVTGVRTPVRAPRANSIAERVVRTFRGECLDHVIVVNERHLQALLTEFVRFYNQDRPHPEPRTRDAGA